jgi:hypothetical protein
MVEAHPSSIIFIYFNFSNPKTHDKKFRMKIADIFSKIRPKIKSIIPGNFPLFAESQMVPDGFSGRLEKTVNTSSQEKPIEIGHVKIRFPNGLKQFSELLSLVHESFAEEGVEFEAIFDDSPELGEDEVARFYGFVGNQLDSSGSWSFLFGPPKGQMSLWLPEVIDEFNRLFQANSREERLIASKAFHQKILSNAYVVPLLIGRHRYFLSKRIDANLWNNFDLRLRLYLLRWK